MYLDISDISLCEGSGFGFFNKKEVEQLHIISTDKKILEDFKII